MAVTADQKIERSDADKGWMPVAASKTLYQGTLAFVASGYASDDDNGGANAFAGIVVQKADNASGSAGGEEVELYLRGKFKLSFPGVTLTQADVGATAYATDNYTCTDVATSATAIGKIVEFIDANTAMVQIDPFAT